jgi:hypothetical protein
MIFTSPCGALAERGEPFHVAEHHRHHPALAFGGGKRRLVEQPLGDARIDIAAEGLADALVLAQPLDHAVEGSRELANLIACRHADGVIEPAGLDLAGAFEQTQHRTGDVASDQHREHETEHRGNGGYDRRDDDRLVLLANDGVRADVHHLLQHVGTDRVDLAGEFLAECVRLKQRFPRAIEIPRVELLQHQTILLVETAMQIVDRGVDAIVEPAERGIVRWRRGIGNDGVDLLARGLCFLLDLGSERLEGLQMRGIGRLVGRRLHFGDDHLPQRQPAFERFDVGPREVAIGRHVAVGQLVQQMTDARGHHHRQQRGDHGQHDQAGGDADNLLLDGFSKHCGTPVMQGGQG